MRRSGRANGDNATFLPHPPEQAPGFPVLTTELLCHRPDLAPLVASWLVAEWPGWYGRGGSGDVARDVASFAASASALPLGVVVFEGGRPIGFGALKAQSIPSHDHLSPWAAAGRVEPAQRGRGVGAVLLRELVAQAARLGFPAVHCGTSTSAGLLVRAGWRLLETVSHDGRPLGIYRIAASRAPPSR